MNESATGNSSHGRWARYLGTGVALVALYVLSPGPLAKVLMVASERGASWSEEGWMAFGILYAPLEFAADHLEPIEHFYDAYFALCGIESE